MDSMAIIEEQKKRSNDGYIKHFKKTQTMVRLAIIWERIILETTVRLSISRKDENYG